MQITEQLKEIWAKVLALDLDEIDENANFFERKGYSSEPSILAHKYLVGGDSVSANVIRCLDYC
jgi:hypothetical protein